MSSAHYTVIFKFGAGEGRPGFFSFMLHKSAMKTLPSQYIGKADHKEDGYHVITSLNGFSLKHIQNKANIKP